MKQALNHLRQPRPHGLDAVRPFPPHLAMEEPHILLEVLDGPRRETSNFFSAAW